MFVDFLKIQHRNDIAQIVNRLQTQITTHFYDVHHFESEHLATPAEALEYLDLLLKLAKTFPEDNSRFVRYNGACFVIVARLMSMAGIELSEYDRQHILDYTTIKYDSDYLNYACQIRDADMMVSQIGDFWRFVTLQEFSLQRAEKVSDKIDITSRLKPIKRFRLRLELAQYMDWARHDADFLKHQYTPTVLKLINDIYQSDLKHICPLIFYCPANVKEKLFDTEEFENEARVEWESCDLHCKFDDEKLARLLDLEPGLRTDISVYHPDTGEIIYAKYDNRYANRREEILNVYPELEPYYYPYIAFDFLGRGEDCCSEQTLRPIIQDFARAFGAEKYLPMANYSRRERLPGEGHLKKKIPGEKQAMADAILDFIKNAK